MDNKAGPPQLRPLPKRYNDVRTACQHTTTALDRLSRALIEAGSNDEWSIESAARHLDMTLSLLRQSSCEDLADLREKCRVFRRLEELLEPRDALVQLVAFDLVQETADLLERLDAD